MPNIAEPRDKEIKMTVREGGNFYVGLDGPPGEATHVLIGIEDLQAGDVVRRAFDADRAADIADNLLEVAQLIREGK